MLRRWLSRATVLVCATLALGASAEMIESLRLVKVMGIETAESEKAGLQKVQVKIRLACYQSLFQVMTESYTDRSGRLNLAVGALVRENLLIDCNTPGEVQTIRIGEFKNSVQISTIRH